MIKIGCNSLSIKYIGVSEFIGICNDLRLDSIDFHETAFKSREPAYLASIKLLCLKYGLPIAYIGVSGLFHGTAEKRKAHAENAKQVIDLAAFVGSPLIRMFCAEVPEKNGDGEPTWPAMVDGYQEVADYGAERGVSVGLQNHPSTGDDMLRILKDVDRENFNLLVDTGQWLGSPGVAPLGVPDSTHNFYEYMDRPCPTPHVSEQSSTE